MSYPVACPRGPSQARWTLVLLAGLLAWEASGLDLPLARAWLIAGEFPLRHDWLLETVLHDGARRLGWLLAAVLVLAVGWPVGPLRRLPRSARAQLALSTLLAAAVVSLAKGLSATSCPWDLQGFGGLGQYAPHWSTGRDGGPGHCFPAGHASTGFAFFSVYFAFREVDPRLARRALLLALAAGSLLGLAQQLRGAHFASHTLWTAWICWTTAWLVDRVARPASRPSVTAA